MKQNPKFTSNFYSNDEPELSLNLAGTETTNSQEVEKENMKKLSKKQKSYNTAWFIVAPFHC